MAGKQPYTPLFTIGICAYNEEENIGHLLGNLLTQQHIPIDSEIIVVCSGCTDKTPYIVEEFAKKDSRVKLIIEKERMGKSQAVNTLLSNAKGNIIVVVSADTQPAPGSLLKLIKSLKNDIAGACAKTIPVNSEQTIMSSCYNFLWRVHNRLLHYLARKNALGHLGGDMWAIRKGIVSYIPNTVINDDAYIGTILKKKGWRITFVPEAEVFIKGPVTPLAYIQQRVRVIVGHRQIKEIVGVEPTTIGALIFKKPLFSLRILLDEVRTYKLTYSLQFFVGICLEVLAQILALIRLREKQKFVKWKQIRSTKSFR
ncbi:MAG: glycosyltransferase [Candidatus Bathyarchaeia archaeon]